MPEIEPNVPRRLALVRELVPATVSEHVNVHRERQIGILTVLLDDKRRSPNLMRESGQEEAITKESPSPERKAENRLCYLVLKSGVRNPAATTRAIALNRRISRVRSRREPR
jgi:hypothetical protein